MPELPRPESPTLLWRKFRLFCKITRNTDAPPYLSTEPTPILWHTFMEGVRVGLQAIVDNPDKSAIEVLNLLHAKDDPSWEAYFKSEDNIDGSQRTNS